MFKERLSGKELIALLEAGEVLDESIIKVFYEDPIFDNVKYLYELNYRNDELYWEPNTFRMSTLYNESYFFQIIKPKEDTIIDKIEIDNFDRIQAPSTGNYVYKLTMKEKILLKKLNEVIDYINENGKFNE